MARRFPEALAATARGLSKRMSEAGRGWPAFEAVFYEGLGRIGTRSRPPAVLTKGIGAKQQSPSHSLRDPMASTLGGNPRF